MLLTLLPCLGGCSAGPSAPPGRTEVVLWSGWTGHEGKAFQSMVDRFNTTHPHLFVYDLNGVQDDTKTIRAITAGVPPDVAFLWTPAYLGPMAANGGVRPLDGYFRRSGLKTPSFVPASLEMCRYRNRLYAMPYLIDVTALFWNKDAFRQAGLDPERPPQTLDELAADAVRLTRRDGRGGIARLGLSLPDIQVICAIMGGRFADPRTGQVTADTPANVRAFTWYKALVDRMGGVRQVTAFESGFGPAQGANHPFFVGKVAMMVSGEWIPFWVQRYAPRLRYGVTWLPFDPQAPGRRHTTVIGGNPACIPAGSRHPRAAWEFLRWMQGYAQQEAFADALSNVPNIRAVLASPRLTQGSQRRRSFGFLCRVANSPTAQVFPNDSVANYYLAEIDHARDFVLNGDKTPSQALRDLQRNVEREMARMGPD